MSKNTDKNQKPLNILFRSLEVEKKNWSIRFLPIQKKESQSPIVNLGSGGSCVMAGTRVLLADGSQKIIESFQGGEIVKTLTGFSRVRALEQIKLGVTRRVIELDTGVGNPLFVSDEHPIWTRFKDNEKEFEWWGVYNFNHYLVEKVNGYGVQLVRDAIPLRFDTPQLHAHVDGWKDVQPIYHVMHPDTPLFHLDVETGGSYIADGFVISSHAADKDGERVEWRGIGIGSADKCREELVVV